MIYKQNKLAKNKIEPFVPGKSHRTRVINDPDKHRAKLTKWQIGLGIGGVVFLFMREHFSFGAMCSLISGLIGIQVMKIGIKVHTPIDEASLFELEERGLITSKDLVKCLYKDFESWTKLKPNAKLLILTQNRLISIIFNDIKNAVRNECRLSEINKLGFANFESMDSATGSGTIIFYRYSKQ